MSYPINAMVSLKIGNSRQPALIFGEPEEGEVTIPAKPATPDGRFPERPARTQPATWQMAVSLRTTLPDENGETRTFYHISRERTDNLLFTSPRTKAVVGLDADENGEIIPLDTLIELAVADYDARQAERAALAEASLTTTGATL